MAQLTGAQMKYLHVIYLEAQKTGNGVRSIDVARALDVTKASVSRMVSLLAGMGLISMKNRGSIKLTPQGKNEGMAIHEKVIHIHSFFARYLELEEPEALDNTYSFLCGFSDHCIERLVRKNWATDSL